MSDPEDTEDPMPSCDLCGDSTGPLVEVEDRDDSVGYHDTLKVCRECIEDKKGKRINGH